EGASDGHGEVVLRDAVPDKEGGDGKEGGPAECGDGPALAADADAPVFGVDDGAPDGVGSESDAESSPAGAEEVEEADSGPDEGTEGQGGGKSGERSRLPLLLLSAGHRFRFPFQVIA